METWKWVRRIAILISGQHIHVQKRHLPSLEVNGSLCFGSVFSLSLEITSFGFPLLFFLFFGETVASTAKNIIKNVKFIFVRKHLMPEWKQNYFKTRQLVNTNLPRGCLAKNFWLMVMVMMMHNQWNTQDALDFVD